MPNSALSLRRLSDRAAGTFRVNLQFAAGFALLFLVTSADVGKPFGRNWSMCYLLPCFYAAWVLRGSRAWVLFLTTCAIVFAAPLTFAPELLTTVSYMNRLLGVLTGTIVFSQASRRQRNASLMEASNKELECRVSERTSELEAANRSLKVEIAERQQAEEQRRTLERQLLQSQKMEAMGKLTGGIAHDFNNLLTVIIGCGETLLATLPQNNDATRRSVQAIVDAVLRAASLTGQLLAFSRRSMLAPKVLLLEEVIRDCEAMLRRLISEDIELTFRFNSDDCKVRVDPNLLSQALINLVINARDSIELQRRRRRNPGRRRRSGAIRGDFGRRFRARRPARYSVMHLRAVFHDQERWQRDWVGTFGRNLVRNAIESREIGAAVELSTNCNESRVEFSVSDNGGRNAGKPNRSDL
jgi:signal transduction histidine kinase